MKKVVNIVVAVVIALGFLATQSDIVLELGHAIACHDCWGVLNSMEEALACHDCWGLMNDALACHDCWGLTTEIESVMV